DVRVLREVDRVVAVLLGEPGDLARPRRVVGGEVADAGVHAMEARRYGPRMAEEGQLFEAPDGNTLRLVRITDDLLEMEATYSGEGAMPPPHFHPSQE